MKPIRIVLPLFLFTLTACSVSFCGPLDTGPRGGSGERCRTDGTSPCNDGLTCGTGNRCEACGGNGQLCCHPIGTRDLGGCNGSLNCSNDRCTSCGEPGPFCCFFPGDLFGVCAAGASCDVGRGCVASTTPPGPCGGPSSFAVHCESDLGCGSIQIVNSTDRASAEECARTTLGCASLPSGLLDPAVTICLDPRPFGFLREVTVPAFSEEAALRCAETVNGLEGTVGHCPEEDDGGM